MYGQMRAGREQRVVLARVQYAHNWYSRLVGLLGTTNIEDDQAIWLLPCGSIHTIGMNYAIDVLFLNREQEILKIAKHIVPYRLCFAGKSTYSVLEMKAGKVDQLGLQVGDPLKFECLTTL